MLVGRTIPGTRKFLGWPGVSVSSLGLLILLVTVIAVAVSTSGSGDASIRRADRPLPTLPVVNLNISADVKLAAKTSITDNPEVLDAAITQDGRDISLVLIVAFTTGESRARQLGDNFVRMIKSLSQDESPGKVIGTGMYSYLVGVYYPDEEKVALGAKSRVADRISW